MARTNRNILKAQNHISYQSSSKQYVQKLLYRAVLGNVASQIIPCELKWMWHTTKYYRGKGREGVLNQIHFSESEARKRKPSEGTNKIPTHTNASGIRSATLSLFFFFFPCLFISLQVCHIYTLFTFLYFLTKLGKFTSAKSFPTKKFYKVQIL